MSRNHPLFARIAIPLALLAAGCGVGNDDGTANEATSTAVSEDADDVETQIAQRLNGYDTTTPFTVLIRTNDGQEISHSVGDTTSSTLLESASTSKLVTAVVILTLVEDGTLTLDDHPQEHIPTWPTSGELANITLAQLLSFTSGLAEGPFCANSGRADFTNCAERIPGDNDSPAPAGSEFHYGSSHMQVAGQMAIDATGHESWTDLFEQFQSDFGVFPDSTYDLPSANNPRLAGGMHWTAADYVDFLDALVHEQILTNTTLAELSTDQLGSASVAYSPVLDARGQDWHYGYGAWIECASVTYDCDQTTRISSPGAYGAYPFIDLEHGYYGIIARQGRLGTFGEGLDIFDTIVNDLEQWAS